MVSGGSARSVCAAAPGQSRWLARFCFNSFILADSEKGATSVSLSSPWRANGELGLAAGRGAEDLVAELALDWSLAVRENRADVVALVASYVEEEGVGSLDEFLKFVHVLFRDRVRVQKVHFHFWWIGFEQIFNNKHTSHPHFDRHY